MSKRLLVNSAASFVQQVITIICGLLLSRALLLAFGSEINGLNASINQFLAIITMLEGGVNTVARVAFYKALAKGEAEGINVTYQSTALFFKKLSSAFFCYLILLAFAYPFIERSDYDYVFVASLVFVLGISSVFEYLFGQTNQILLFADQKGYIYSAVQIVFCIMRTCVAILLIKAGYSVHVVRAGSALVYILRPMLLNLYVRNKYRIKRTYKSIQIMGKQGNAAFIRHLSQYVHSSTDIIILTIFSDLKLLSVYAIYQYIIHCLTIMVSSIFNNSEARFGELIANNRMEEMEREFNELDLLYKMISCAVFSTSIFLTPQFVRIYTDGVNDVDYSQPLFAFIMSIAEMLYCMGLIYQNIYTAGGYFKETQHIAILEMIVNAFVSILLVKDYGIIGVATGTFLSILIKNIMDIVYTKRIIHLSVKRIVSMYISVLVFAILVYFSSIKFTVLINNLYYLIAVAFIVFTVFSCVIICYCRLMYTEETKQLLEKIRIGKRRSKGQTPLQ